MFIPVVGYRASAKEESIVIFINCNLYIVRISYEIFIH